MLLKLRKSTNYDAGRQNYLLTGPNRYPLLFKSPKPF